MLKYNFEEKKENEDPIPVSERIIEKHGLVIKFSMNELLADEIKFEKTLKELKANRDLKQGIIDNMDQHHPFIKEMSEFDRYAVHMYQEAWASRKAFNDKIAEIENDYKEYLEEVAAIKEQLPELKEIVSPLQPDAAGELKEVDPSPVKEEDPAPEVATDSIKTDEEKNNPTKE